jgi:parallel beta-helix repeat protein
MANYKRARELSLLLILAVIVPASLEAAVFRIRIDDVTALIAAIRTANSTIEPDEIVLEPGVYALTQPDNTHGTDGANGLPSITTVITLTSASPQQAAIVIRGSDSPRFRIFHVSSNGTLVLVNVFADRGAAAIGTVGGGLLNLGRTSIIGGGVASSSAAQGGGIANRSGDGVRSGVLILASSSVTNNEAESGGGGILNAGTLIVTDSRIDSNDNGTFGGGGILNEGGGSTSLANSTVDGNTSGAGFFGTGGGPGIYNLTGGILTITNSTISGNLNENGNGTGGGILNRGTMSVYSTTIANNAAQVAGGGIATFGSASLTNTIVAANRTTANDDAPDCFGEVASGGFNLIGNAGEASDMTPFCTLMNSIGDQVGTPLRPIDPLLDPLSFAGGQHTPTHGLAAESPARNLGGACGVTDQRRFRRPAEGICDVGAFEFGAVRDRTTTGPARRVITESTTLMADQTLGLVIERDDIILDCNGHTIAGQGRGAGIELKVRRGVTVRNCVVTNFANGFNLEDATLNVFGGNIARGNGNDGLHIVRSTGNVFDGNIVFENADDGIDLSEATGNLLRSNSSHDNAGIGILLSDVSVGNYLIGNTSHDNRGSGFRIRRGSRRSVLMYNNACNNTGAADLEENSNPNFFQGNLFCTAVGIRPGESIPTEP